MKVFLSWSGARSRAIAEALREWIPNVIQAVEPWMSAEDVDKGLRWSSEIAVQLEDTRFGIICLTPENLESVWILFEAGALSKTIDRAFVCPFLFGLELSDVRGPLTQFQATKAEKEDIKRLILTINKALGDDRLASDKVEKAFEHWWPEIARSLKNVPGVGDKAKPRRADRELLEEILEIVRAEARESRDFSVKRDEMLSTYFQVLNLGLEGDPKAKPQILNELQRLRNQGSHPFRVRLRSYVRQHKVESTPITAVVTEQADGSYTVLVANSDGLQNVSEHFEGLDFAQSFADETVGDAYPHDCVLERCEGWGPAPIPTGGFGKTDASQRK